MNATQPYTGEINHLRQENDLELLQLTGFMLILLTSYCLKRRFPKEQACFLLPLTVFLILSLQEHKVCSTDILLEDIVQYTQNPVNPSMF